MLRLFCCRNRKTSKVEADEITDSLEKCLSVERGVTEFRDFLKRGHFDEVTALEFALRCDRILTESGKLSLRNSKLPAMLENDIRNLREMADNINFDLGQMKTLEELPSMKLEEKLSTIATVRGWAIDLLRQKYDMFKREVLNKEMNILKICEGCCIPCTFCY